MTQMAYLWWSNYDQRVEADQIHDKPELSSAVALGAVFAVDGRSATSILASGVAVRAVCGRCSDDFKGATWSWHLIINQLV